MQRASRWLTLAVIAFVVTDWIAKLWIVNRIGLGETVALVDGWFYLVHRQNPGIAFSLLADLPDPWRVPFLTSLSAFGVLLFIRLIRSTRDDLARFAAAAVVAGAVANLGDRVWSGDVTDYLYLAFLPVVFNLADAAITMGGSVLAVRLATGEQGEAPTPLIG